MKKNLVVKNINVNFFSQSEEDYISLTDIARYKNSNEPKDIVKNWMRNKKLWQKCRFCLHRSKKSELGIEGSFPSHPLPVKVKEAIVRVVFYAKSQGIPKVRICALLQINVRRIERWVSRRNITGNMEYSKPGPRHPVNSLMPYEKQAVLNYVQREETTDYSLRVLACKGAELGLYYVSASTIRMILHEEDILMDRRPLFRRTGAGRKPDRPDELTSPNQCW